MNHPVESTALTRSVSAPLRMMPVVLATLAALLAVSAWIRWYANEVSLPRYCDDPARAVATLERIITEKRPAGDGARRPYVVAAKLLFIVPRAADEPLQAYLQRVRAHIAAHCR